MMRLRTILVVGALAAVLGGCDSFDPMDKFQDLDIMGGGKKKLLGDRRPVFDSGVPGVQQGVPPELVKGYVAPTEPPPQVVVEEKKAKPRPKVAARPKPKREPAQAVQPQQNAPVRASAPPAAAWPEPPPPQNNAAWPAPPSQQIPGSQPTWPTTAPPPATR
jgi:outer membrane biosynthesis protein TonB